MSRCATTAAIAKRPGAPSPPASPKSPTAHWRQVFDGVDACCAVVESLEQAVQDSQVVARNLFARRAAPTRDAIPALPVPIVEALRDPALTRVAARLGADNTRLAAGAE